MRLLRGIAAAGLVATACGSAPEPSVSAASTRSTGPTGVWAVREPAVAADPVRAVAPRPAPVRRIDGTFATPEAAMRQLARAYNAGSVDALKQVTTPAARAYLLDMATWAPDLRLVGCGRHSCEFSHGRVGSGERGLAHLTIAPSQSIGWYATVVEDCG